MKLLFLSLILSFCIFDFVKADKKFKFKDCSNGQGIMNISRFSLSPDPISLSKNISASIHITLKEDLPLNTYVKRSIYKITSFFGISISIPAPCIAGVGSCSTDGCEYLKSFKTQFCPFVPADLECECPLKAGIYSGDNVTFPMSQLGSIIKFLASGQFKVEWKLVQKDNLEEKDLACFVFTGTAKR